MNCDREMHRNRLRQGVRDAYASWLVLYQESACCGYTAEYDAAYDAWQNASKRLSSVLACTAEMSDAEVDHLMAVRR